MPISTWWTTDHIALPGEHCCHPKKLLNASNKQYILYQSMHFFSFKRVSNYTQKTASHRKILRHVFLNLIVGLHLFMPWLVFSANKCRTSKFHFSKANRVQVCMSHLLSAKTLGYPQKKTVAISFDMHSPILIRLPWILVWNPSLDKKSSMQWSVRYIFYPFLNLKHDDVIKWKHFPRYWPFVRGIHRSPVNSPHKGQWRGALMFTLIWARVNGWVNTREVGDLRRHQAHCDVIVMGLHH